MGNTSIKLTWLSDLRSTTEKEGRRYVSYLITSANEVGLKMKEDTVYVYLRLIKNLTQPRLLVTCFVLTCASVIDCNNSPPSFRHMDIVLRFRRVAVHCHLPSTYLVHPLSIPIPL